MLGNLSPHAQSCIILIGGPLLFLFILWMDDLMHGGLSPSAYKHKHLLAKLAKPPAVKAEKYTGPNLLRSADSEYRDLLRPACQREVESDSDVLLRPTGGG